MLENNVWGGQWEPHLQCMTAGPGWFGWNVSRLSPSKYGGGECPSCIEPYCPEVIYGKSPWRIGSTTSSLPVPLDSVESLEVSMMVRINPHPRYAKYDLAFDIWITNGTESGRAYITDEVMIWLVWTPGLAGEIVLDTMNDGYNTYEHRAYAHWNMIRIEAPWKWRMQEFTIAKQGIPSTIDVLAFLNHLRKERYGLRYLASIEFGNEVWSGVGATNITVFRVDLKTNPALVVATDNVSKNQIFDARCGLLSSVKSETCFE